MLIFPCILMFAGVQTQRFLKLHLSLEIQKNKVNMKIKHHNNKQCIIGSCQK